MTCILVVYIVDHLDGIDMIAKKRFLLSWLYVTLWLLLRD